MKTRKNDNYFFIYLFEFCVERPFYPFFRLHNSGFDGFGCEVAGVKTIWMRGGKNQKNLGQTGNNHTKN